MGDEQKISAWLQGRGFALVFASFENTAESPVYYVAHNSQLRQVVVAVRGTMSLSDAVTNMIGAQYCSTIDFSPSRAAHIW